MYRLQYMHSTETVSQTIFVIKFSYELASTYLFIIKRNKLKLPAYYYPQYYYPQYYYPQYYYYSQYYYYPQYYY